VVSGEAEELFGKFEEVAPGIARIPDNAATLLGSRLSEEAIEGVITGKTADTAGRLATLTPHSAFFLLPASVSIPRLICFLIFSFFADANPAKQKLLRLMSRSGVSKCVLAYRRLLKVKSNRKHEVYVRMGIKFRFGIGLFYLGNINQ